VVAFDQLGGVETICPAVEAGGDKPGAVVDADFNDAQGKGAVFGRALDLDGAFEL
jgi:hypothetical protein